MKQNVTDVTNAVLKERSDQSLEHTVLSPEAASESFESSTLAIPADGLAQISGTPSTDYGSREAWRAGHQTGLQEGAARYFHSRVMESLAMELVFLRSMLEQQSRRADFWHERFADAVKELMR